MSARAGASWVSSRARDILSIAAMTFIIHILDSFRAFSVVVTASMVFVGVVRLISSRRGPHSSGYVVAAFGRTPPLAFLIGGIGELAGRRDLRHVFQGVGHMHFFHLAGTL